MIVSRVLTRSDAAVSLLRRARRDRGDVMGASESLVAAPLSSPAQVEIVCGSDSIVYASISENNA